MKNLILFTIFLTFVICCQYKSDIPNTSIKENIENKRGIYDIAYNKYFDTTYGKEYRAFIFQLDSGKEICYKGKYNPIISPNGKKILISKFSKNKVPYRAVIDINTGNEVKIMVKETSFEAWSPESNYIAFSFFDTIDNLYKIATLKIDNTNYRILNFYSEKNLNRPTWTTDGKFIITSDGNNMYRIGVAQYDIDTINIFKTFFSDSCMTGSSARYWITSNNSYIVFNANTGENMEGIVPSPEAIFAYDMALKKVMRISPKGMSATEPYLGLNNEIYFTGYTNIKANLFGIYKVNIYDKKVQLIVDKAKNPSCRVY